MRVIICGGGKVGFNIAATLAREGNDVTVIDKDARIAAEINNDMDARCILGHASTPDSLKAAGADNADMIIAVTSSDEVNMVACQIGHSLFGIPNKIARIRRQDYLKPEWANLFSRTHMPIDTIISPEVVVAKNIFQRLLTPGTSYAAEIAEGNAGIISVVCGEACPVLRTPVEQLERLFSDIDFKIIGISRKHEMFLPEKTDQLMVGDECFMIVKDDHISRVLSSFGHNEKEAHNIVIAGGGNIGAGLAAMLLERNPKARIKIIEHNEGRAKYLSEHMPRVIVLNGSALDLDLLKEASINDAESFIAVTNDDESNILGSLLAKRLGCKHSTTLVNNEVYTSLLGSMDINSLVMPGAIIGATIMQHVRRGRIRGLYNLHDGHMEVTEAEVSDSAFIANKTIEELELPEGVMIAGFMYDEEFKAAKDEDYIKPDDHIIIVNTREKSAFVEKLFVAHVDLF